MGEQVSSIEQLQSRLKELQSVEFKWVASKAKTGRCEEYYDHEKEDPNKLIVMDLGWSDEDEKLCFCKKHWTEERFESAKRKVEEKINDLKDEISFQQKLGKITRFAQIKDMVDASKAILQRKQESYDHPLHLSTDEKQKIKRLLRLLRQIEPKSSQFVDRGVAITENLWLSGTASADSYSSRPEPKITLTALDCQDRYNAVARVQLRLGEAERMRGLVTECVEHVRIKGLIAQIEEKFGEELGEGEDD